MNRSIVRARVTAAVDDVLYTPDQRAGRNPVIYIHGQAATGLQAAGVGLTSIPAILDALRLHLFTPLGVTLPLDHFGNAAAQSAIAAAIAWSNSNLGTSGKAVLIASSSGAGAALVYAADHPTGVACVEAFIPALDYQYLRVNDVGPGLRAASDAAYSIIYPALVPAGYDPATRTADLVSVPHQLWVDPADAVSANYASFAAATGADLHATLSGGHGDASIAQIDISAMVAYVEAHRT